MNPDRRRPRLLPQNRRLRHLQGISLRNLSFSPQRWQSADDSALAATPSAASLRASSVHLDRSLSTNSVIERPGKPRRRSTNFAGISPLSRQRKLEIALDAKVADVFFSLHLPGDHGSEPLYISEVGERAMNFDFRFFYPSDLPRSASQSSRVLVRVWARHPTWALLLEDDIDLRYLNFIGPLEQHRFPHNCLLFHLVDGTYAAGLAADLPPSKPMPNLPTSSYSALIRLATLDNSIQDAIATRDALAAQINQIIVDSKGETLERELFEAQESAARAERYLAAQRRAVRAAQNRRDELRASIAARRAAIQEGQRVQALALDEISHAEGKLQESAATLSRTRELIIGQRRRICEDLTRIFRIGPTSPTTPPLSFGICGIPLPNTDYDPSAPRDAEERLNAALGLVVQLVHALQFYLSVPLPYSLHPFGSRSSIRDDIAASPDAQREYPLYLRGGAAAQTRFDYGWFLLNRDIEVLCAFHGLKVVDLRHTLPNLKYLLYVASAGSEELPERKKGGVRGLWAGRMKGRLAVAAVGGDGSDSVRSSSGSRRGSNDSDALGRHIGALRIQFGKDHAKAELGGGGLGESWDSNSPPSIFDESLGKLTLRTKGLRENADRGTASGARGRGW